jgi:hypothetical protein
MLSDGFGAAVTANASDDSRLKYREAYVVKRIVNGPQDQRGITLPAIVRAGLRRRTCGHGQPGALPAANACVEATASSVERPIGENAIQPPFEHGRHSEPPQWELKHEKIGPQEIVDLPAYIGWQRASLGTEALLSQSVEPIRVFTLRKMAGVFHWIEFAGVQVSKSDCVAPQLKCLFYHARQRAVEGLRLRMGQYNQDVQMTCYPRLQQTLSRACHGCVCNGGTYPGDRTADSFR